MCRFKLTHVMLKGHMLIESEKLYGKSFCVQCMKIKRGFYGCGIVR